MKSKRKNSEKLLGNDREAIPDIAFRMMTFYMTLMDLFGQHSNKNFETLGLKNGQTVIDYGCGPARYIRKASATVGETGKVIAVDIHPLAIKKVKEKIKKFSLNNVETVLADGYKTLLASETADVVFALDMFHMIEQPKEFLTEISRLVKPDGTIIIEDGHQPRSKTIKKIEDSGILTIFSETKVHVKCKKKI